MDQKWLQVLVIVVFYQKVTSGADVRVVKENDPVKINCQTISSATVIWFRVLDASGMEFIASFANTGVKRSEAPWAASIFTYEKNKIQLRSFSKRRDSGSYSCASMKGSELIFGNVTKLVGEKEAEVAVEAPPTSTTPTRCTTAPACVCDNEEVKTSPSLICEPIILIPLASGCGLLLLLLIITTLYCNHIRTRRCPHHYKRQPRTTAPAKQMKTTRHI